MSFESNKDDFEAALNELEGIQASIEGVINSDITDLIEAVINEYNNHYYCDIKALLDKIENLEEEIESFSNHVT